MVSQYQKRRGTRQPADDLAELGGRTHRLSSRVNLWTLHRTSNEHGNHLFHPQQKAARHARENEFSHLGIANPTCPTIPSIAIAILYRNTSRVRAYTAERSTPYLTRAERGSKATPNWKINPQNVSSAATQTANPPNASHSFHFRRVLAQRLPRWEYRKSRTMSLSSSRPALFTLPWGKRASSACPPTVALARRCSTW